MNSLDPRVQPHPRSNPIREGILLPVGVETSFVRSIDPQGPYSYPNSGIVGWKESRASRGDRSRSITIPRTAPDAVCHRSAPDELWEICAANDHQPYTRLYSTLEPTSTEKTESESREATGKGNRKGRLRSTVANEHRWTPLCCQWITLDQVSSRVPQGRARAAESDEERWSRETIPSRHGPKA